jgi:hypothetical protein
MNLEPSIWGPHFWFFLHTTAMCYPQYPNAVTKKKYYEFVQNIPMFIPVEKMASDFSKLLDEYPVTSYLDNRESFVKWMWFIHNKINQKLEKPTLSLNDFYVKYYEEYKSKNVKLNELYRWREKFIYGGLILSIAGTIYYLYDK